MMRNTIEAIWPVFDADGSGSIERNEFLLPNDGGHPEESLHDRYMTIIRPLHGRCRTVTCNDGGHPEESVVFCRL